MVDGEAQFLQQALGRFQAIDLGESLFQVREDGGVEIEGLAVFLDQPGGVVGDGLALRAATSFDYDLNVHRWVAGCRAMSFMGRV